MAWIHTLAARRSPFIFFFVLLYFSCFFFIENNNNSNRRNVSLFSLQRSFSLVGLRAISRPVNRSRIERYAVPVPFHNWVQWWQWKRLRSTFFFVSTVVRRNVSSSSAGNSFHRSSVTCCLVFFLLLLLKFERFLRSTRVWSRFNWTKL